MITRLRASWLPAALLLLAGCTSSPTFVADPSLLVPWSGEAQRRMPEPPYVARYEHEGKSLSYVAARHEHAVGNATFELVERELEAFRPDVVLVEGLETVHGPSPAFYLEGVERTQRGDSYPMGEAGFAASLASAAGIPFFGGEPSEEEIRDSVVVDGMELRDLVYFYVVRQVPQWKRTGEDQEFSFEELFSKALAHYRRALSLEDDTLDDPRAFEAWYRDRNGRPFRYEEITTEVCAPVAGLLFTNDMSLAIGEVRDTHIVRTIAGLLNEHDRVLVVYGAGHHVQQEKVLEKMLGTPRAMARD